MALTASWMTPFTLVAAAGLALPISAQPVPGPSPARASAPQRASVIDLRSGAIDTSSGFAGWAAKYHQTGKLPNYALAVVVGIVVIAIVAFGYRT